MAFAGESEGEINCLVEMLELDRKPIKSKDMCAHLQWLICLPLLSPRIPQLFSGHLRYRASPASHADVEEGLGMQRIGANPGREGQPEDEIFKSFQELTRGFSCCKGRRVENNLLIIVFNSY